MPGGIFDADEANATYRQMFVDNAPSSSEVLQALKVFGSDRPPTWKSLEKVNTFCKRCSAIDWSPVQMYLAIADEYSFYPKVPLYRTCPKVGQVRDAAHDSCHLCTLILTCLLTMRYRAFAYVDPLGSGLFNIDDDCDVDVYFQATALNSPVSLNVTINDSDHGVSHWLDLGLPIVSSLVHHNHLIKRTSTITFASPAERIAKHWIDDCRLNHGACEIAASKLPKRVIDVHSVHPFLFETNHIEGEYVTLSYCWGQGNVLKTEKTTIKERMAGIQIDLLPQTVQDAIWWTRKLGLRYLWVDALCIIQDDPSDLDVELSVMADIYRDSTITIAATASASVLEGCLPNPNKLNLAPCTPVSEVIIQPDYGRQKWIFQKGALEERAWTFQEVQLSRRVLRVGGEELAWQCRKCKRREGDPLAQMVHESQSLGTFFGTRVLDDPQRLKGDTLFIFWYQIVQQFLTRSLSFSADKFPAFSGMASHVAGIIERQSKNKAIRYFAGLWEEDLLHGLLWRTLYEPGPPIPYRAPSWSWAAYESKIVYHSHALQVRDFCTEILDTQVTVPGANPYGKVTSGKLTLLGPTAPVPPQIYEDDSEVGIWKWRWPLLTWDNEGPQPLGCVCLRLQKRCCLILAPVDKRWRDNTYRRIGMLVTPTELEDPEEVKLQILEQLEWEDRVLTII